MAFDLNKSWGKVKRWWQSDTCFVKNPYFWLLTGATVAAVLLTGGFLLPILGAIPFYAVAAEKDVLHWVNTKNWIRGKLADETILLKKSDAPTVQEKPFNAPANDVIADSTSKPHAFHSHQFKEGLLFLSWIKADFLKLPSSNELDMTTEQEDLKRLFSTPLDSDSKNSETSVEHQTSIQVQLNAYEAERQAQATENGLLTKPTLLEQLKKKVTFARRVFIPFSEDNVQQRANLVPQHLNIFEKKIPQKKISALYNLVYRVFHKISQLPENTLFSTKTSDQRLTEKEQVWFDNWLKKSNEEIAEIEEKTKQHEQNILVANAKTKQHEQNILVANAKTKQHEQNILKNEKRNCKLDRDIARLDKAILNVVQELVQEAMSSTPHNFSTLKDRVKIDTLYEIAIKKQLSDEEIAALLDASILDSTTLKEKIQNLSPRNSEDSLLSTDSEALSDSSGSTTDKNSKNNLDRKSSSIKDSESIRFTGKKRDNSSIQNEVEATLGSALTSH